MATLLIDDKKQIRADRVARTYAEAIAALTERRWDLVYLDHDIADFSGPGGRELTGYDVVCWLEAHPEHLPARIEIVSHNPVGRQNIARVLDRLYR